MNQETVRQWLSLDTRRVRPASYTNIYPLTVEIIIKKTQCLLPKKLITGKRILDLGAGIPYFELWCNENDAHYTGVEIQKETAKKAMGLISRSNDFYHDSIENFIDYSDLSTYDIIVCSSTLHLVNDYMEYLNKLLESQKIIVIEEDLKAIGDGSLSVRDRVPNYTDDPNISVEVQKYHADLKFIKHHLTKSGYNIDERPYQLGQKILPDWFGSKKYFVHGIPNDNSTEIITMHNREWGDSDKAFEEIPDFHFIIKSIPRILKEYNVDLKSRVLDFGCGSGSALRSLKYAGYQNIFGLDLDQSLLDSCPYGLANYRCSDIIDEKYQVILANWNLFKRSDKWQILKNIRDRLEEKGLLILSEQINNNDTMEKYQSVFTSMNLNYRLYNLKSNFATWILTNEF